MLARLHNLGGVERRVDASDIEGYSGDKQPCIHGGAPSVGVGYGGSVPVRLSAAVGPCLEKSNWRGNMHSEHSLEKRGTGVK